MNIEDFPEWERAYLCAVPGATSYLNSNTFRTDILFPYRMVARAAEYDMEANVVKLVPSFQYTNRKIKLSELYWSSVYDDVIEEFIFCHNFGQRVVLFHTIHPNWILII